MTNDRMTYWCHGCEDLKEVDEGEFDYCLPEALTLIGPGKKSKKKTTSHKEKRDE